MKTWSIPQADVQPFAANEYVSACYSVLCVTPNNNAPQRYVYEDTNKNGTFEAGTDQLIFDAATIVSNKKFAGCGGRHPVTIRGGEPSNNGFIAPPDDPNNVVPYLYWYGSVIDPAATGTILDMHGTDLSRDDAIIPAENPNFS